jgi:hypothetical protein
VRVVPAFAVQAAGGEQRVGASQAQLFLRRLRPAKAFERERPEGDAQQQLREGEVQSVARGELAHRAVAGEAVVELVEVQRRAVGEGASGGQPHLRVVGAAQGLVHRQLRCTEQEDPALAPGHHREDDLVEYLVDQQRHRAGRQVEEGLHLRLHAFDAARVPAGQCGHERAQAQLRIGAHQGNVDRLEQRVVAEAGRCVEQGGTVAHVLEQLFGLVARHPGGAKSLVTAGLLVLVQVRLVVGHARVGAVEGRLVEAALVLEGHAQEREVAVGLDDGEVHLVAANLDAVPGEEEVQRAGAVGLRAEGGEPVRERAAARALHHEAAQHGEEHHAADQEEGKAITHEWPLLLRAVPEAGRRFGGRRRMTPRSRRGCRTRRSRSAASARGTGASGRSAP